MSTNLTKKVNYSPNERLDLFDKRAEDSLADLAHGEYLKDAVVGEQDGRVFYGWTTPTVIGPNLGFTISALPGYTVDRGGAPIIMDGSTTLTDTLLQNSINYFHSYHEDVPSDDSYRRFYASGVEYQQITPTRLTRTPGLHRKTTAYGTGVPSLSNFDSSAVIGGVAVELVPLYAVAVDGTNNITGVYDFRPMFAPGVNGAGGNQYDLPTNVPDFPHNFLPVDLATLGVTDVRSALVALADRLRQVKGTTNWWDDSSGLAPSVQATWPIGTVRYFAVDYDSGLDTNSGFSDVSMSAAGAVAVKTIEKLATFFPKNGAGRIAVVAIRARAGGLVYRNALDTADAELDFLRGVSGYQHLIVRGTDTVATAGATAFANDTADKIALGGRIFPGTNVAGYEPTGVPTNNTFTCQLTGGGAPGFGAEPALIGKRVRFDSATTTAALQNACRMIHEHTASSLTLGVNLPAVPVLTDKFYIEEPGVAFDRLVVSSCDSAAQALQPSFSTNNMVIAGIRLPNTGASWVGLSCYGMGNLTLSFIDVASPGFGSVRAGYARFLTVTPSYVDETNTTRTVGPGLRSTGWGTFANLASGCFATSMAFTAGRLQLLSVGAGVNLGGGSYFNLGLLAQNCRGSGATYNTIGGNVFGNSASTSTRRMRTFGGFAGSCISITNTDCFLRGVDIRNAGALSLIQVNGVGASLSINDVVGSTGNTGAGLDLSVGAHNVRILMGQLNVNTFTGAAGRDILGAGPVYYTHADYARTVLRDKRGSEIWGSASTALGPTSFVTNNGVFSLLQYAIVRATGAGLVQSARADSAANAGGVVGVVQSAPTAVPAENAMMATGGATWVQFDAPPTIGNIAYLSPAPFGTATDTPPPVAGTNQKLRLGRILNASGSLGLVTWHPESLPVLSDGLP